MLSYNCTECKKDNISKEEADTKKVGTHTETLICPKCGGQLEGTL